MNEVVYSKNYDHNQTYPADLGTVEFPICVGHYGVYVHVVPKEISGYDYDKYYVGITSDPFNVRWNNGHGYRTQPFGGAVNKYGWNNIKHNIIIDHNYTDIDAKILEQCLIYGLRSYRGWRHGYNGTLGGDGINGSSPSNLKDLTGQVFGRLLVLHRQGTYISKSGKRRTLWHCLCLCGEGNELDVTSDDLLYGNTTSCGCIQRENREQRRPNQFTFFEDEGYAVGHIGSDVDFIIDIDDCEKINQYTWHIKKDNKKDSCDDYIISNEEIVGEKRITHNIIRLILNIPEHNNYLPNIKFLNGNKHDFRKANMEIIIPDKVNKHDYLKYVYMGGIYHLSYLDSTKRWRVKYGKHTKDFNDFNDAYLFWEKYGDKTPSKRNAACIKPIISLNSLEIIYGGAIEATKFTDVKRAAISHSCSGRNEFGGRNLLTGEKIKWMNLEDYNNLSVDEKQKLKDKYYTGNKLVSKEEIE